MRAHRRWESQHAGVLILPADRDGSNGCLLGFLTPMHGDTVRGHGVEKEWD
jgi:hypothetical protein